MTGPARDPPSGVRPRPGGSTNDGWRLHATKGQAVFYTIIFAVLGLLIIVAVGMRSRR